jgi:hypothetical protein
MTPLGYARRRFYVGGWNMQPRRIRFCVETREKAVVYGIGNSLDGLGLSRRIALH